MSPLYIYGCTNKDHPTKEVRHGMREVISSLVCSMCGQPMNRIPQAFQISVPPADSGQRKAREVTDFLKTRAAKNKARQEASEYNRRKAQEGRK